MSHFAHIVPKEGSSTLFTVENVIVAEQDFICTLPNPSEWVQTSYNTRGGVHLFGGTPLRKNYAGVGHTYDLVRDAFYAPQPFPSWTLNESTCLWEAPTQMPTEGLYRWDETTLSWESI